MKYTSVVWSHIFFEQRSLNCCNHRPLTVQTPVSVHLNNCCPFDQSRKKASAWSVICCGSQTQASPSTRACQQALLPAKAQWKRRTEALTPILMRKLSPGTTGSAHYMCCALSVSALSASPREKVFIFKMKPQNI